MTADYDTEESVDQIHERAALSLALVSADTAVYPRRLLWSLLRPRNREFDQNSLAVVRQARDALGVAPSTGGGSNAAMRRVLSEDIDAVEREIVSLLGDESRTQMDGIIDDCMNYAGGFLRDELGLDWEPLPVWIHDRYPEPAGWQDTYAFTALEPIAGSIARGIHFRRDQMFPDLVRIATYHENVHVSALGPGLYLPFDNGVADFLAFLMHFRRANDSVATFGYRTYLSEVSPTLTEYPRYSQAVASLVLQAGLEGLRRILHARIQHPQDVDWAGLFRAGREGSLDVEAALGPDPKAHYPIDPGLEDTARTVAATLIYPETVVFVSPEAYICLAELVSTPNRTREQLAVALGWSDVTASAAADELVDWRLVYSQSAADEAEAFGRPSAKMAPANLNELLGATAIRVMPDARTLSSVPWLGGLRLYALGPIGVGIPD